MTGVLSRFYKIAWESMDWLYPPICVGCQRKGFRWCSDCQQKVNLIPLPLCEQCGVSLHGLDLDQSILCDDCKKRGVFFQALRSWAVFEGVVREAILSLKYKKNVGLGEVLSEPMATMLHQLKWQVGCVTPVPLSKARLDERGYNQAALLAFPLALKHGIKYLPRALERVRETHSQVGLSYAARLQNVNRAFKANQRLISGKVVLLVDDVTTTHATLNACASALIEGGAEKVYCLTLARAVLSYYN